MTHRTYRYRLYPTAEQESQFRQFAGVVRFVYNIAFEQRRDWWLHFRRKTGRHLNYFSQSAELTALRAECDWIAAVPHTCELQALRDLDKAFAAFFSGRTGFPSPRKKGANDSFRVAGREVAIRRLNKKWSAVRFPKIGWVKFRDTRQALSNVRTVTICLNAGVWHVCFACEVDFGVKANSLPCVGIDRGVVNTLTLSTGERISSPASLRRIACSKSRAQRTVSRRQKGSRRHAKAMRRGAALQARAARIRLHWAHIVCADIVRRFGTVVLEDLSIANMTASAKGTISNPGRNVRQKAGLNRAILNQGWGIFERVLSYKLEEHGGRLIKVDPRHTSTTCSECGTVDKRSRESQAVFFCRHCGHHAHADHNAAINILRRNTASMLVEEGHWLSVEARTGRGLAIPENPAAQATGGC